MLTENMKYWLKELYLTEAENHRVAASNEHLWALGADNVEAAMLHEMNAEEHRDFAITLEYLASKVDEWED